MISISSFLYPLPGSAKSTIWYRIIEISIAISYFIATMNVVFIKYDTPINILIIRYQIVYLVHPGRGYKKLDIHNIT